jgi:hypothetical protein
MATGGEQAIDADSFREHAIPGPVMAGVGVWDEISVNCDNSTRSERRPPDRARRAGDVVLTSGNGSVVVSHHRRLKPESDFLDRNRCGLG